LSAEKYNPAGTTSTSGYGQGGNALQDKVFTVTIETNPPDGGGGALTANACFGRNDFNAQNACIQLGGIPIKDDSGAFVGCNPFGEPAGCQGTDADGNPLDGQVLVGFDINPGQNPVFKPVCKTLAATCDLANPDPSMPNCPPCDPATDTTGTCPPGSPGALIKLCNGTCADLGI